MVAQPDFPIWDPKAVLTLGQSRGMQDRKEGGACYLWTLPLHPVTVVPSSTGFLKSFLPAFFQEKQTKRSSKKSRLFLCGSLGDNVKSQSLFFW